jgi:predicted transcriptional regulator
MKEKEVREMNGQDTLMHPTRKVLYQFIVENPGTSFQFIKRILRIPEGTLRYHLDHLIRHNRVVSEKKGRNLCYYSSFKRDHPECHLNVELNPDQQLLLDIIRNEPGIGRKELMVRTRLSRRRINYSLRRLRDLRLVWKVNTSAGDGYEEITKDRLKDDMYRILVDRLLKGELSLERFNILKDRLDEM